MADFYVLLHDDPGDRLRQRGRCERAVVRPVVVGVGGQQTGGVKPRKLYHAALKARRKKEHRASDVTSHFKRYRKNL